MSDKISFKQWIKAYGATLLSRDLGVCLNTCQRWANGSRKPSLKLAMRVEKLSSGLISLEEML